ncbi:hypothetical protein [Microbacterium dextranolyticum]|uniref:Pentapeptide repeat-containing protein n=1 Tax=Microbacterium dextranolyticum TaxID=36806 RepID=A0A9W6HMJ4_9MICO|nr:hypothetical protein [Microbacterium dextranolyticum]MBM7462860.1 uncharacterized protein YjbI with pentapeptide repeats [Microbacterium dextranolyticum]GLJ96035.1 hypothetical protein GCM10017591_20980 [Microbacterium dextranolyticum]
MAARPVLPAAPRVGTPDIPHHLEEHVGLEPRADLLAVEVIGLSGDVDASHGRLAEARIAAASVGRLDVTGASLVDVEIDDLRAVALGARDGRWRNVAITGGRIASIDGLRTRWESVVLRGVHIDYLSLASGEIEDVRFVDCRFGTIDLPEARVNRVSFEGCRADDVDTRGLRTTHLDLRGLEALAFTDARSLAGVWFSPGQLERHAAAWAEALGIRVAE